MRWFHSRLVSHCIEQTASSNRTSPPLFAPKSLANSCFSSSFVIAWKLRFDGFGPSDYGGADFPLLKQSRLPDGFPPFYQPQGASHVGGSFADTICVCNMPGAVCQCKDGNAALKQNEEGFISISVPADQLEVKPTGCGMPG